ncbi:hypothetical protein [Nitrosomonas communis]|uniref:hypothetical protein n=1 Tax=Nitrosomonas communis TaxID=44574 RepID=UPI0026EDD533|nr:hypothetical protein [Nitrosomonas communis]MCO6427691.1 hypothetical protein [Nitrosomonas communis]
MLKKRIYFSYTLIARQGRRAMSHVWRLGLALLVALQVLLVVPAVAVAEWRIVPTTAFVGLTEDLTLIKTLGAMQIMSGTGSDQLWVHQHIPVVEGDVIDAILVCYRTFAFAPGDRPPFVTAIQLTETLFPEGSTTRHFDPTDLTAVEDTCYVSSVPDYAPAGAVNLALQVNFNAFDPPGGGDGIIYIGAVAIHVK